MPTGGHSIEWFMRAVERLSVNLECLHSALGVLWGSVIHAAFLLLGQTHDCAIVQELCILCLRCSWLSFPSGLSPSSLISYLRQLGIPSHSQPHIYVCTKLCAVLVASKMPHDVLTRRPSVIGYPPPGHSSLFHST